MRYLKEPYSKVRDEVEKCVQALEAHQKLSDTPVCDFCGGAPPIWVYAAGRLSTGVPMSCWRWCACVHCDADIEADRWTTLEGRISKRLRRMMRMRVGLAAMNGAVKSALQEFHMFAIRI